MKIALLFYEPFLSGQTTHILSLVEGLNRSKYTLSVICPSHDQRMLTRLQATGLTVVPIPMSRLDNRAAAVALFHWLRSQPVDLLHVHSQEAGLWGRVVARLAGVPSVIYTPHTIEMRRQYLRPLYFWVERLLGRITNRLIAISLSQWRQLEKLKVMPATRMVMINNGIDTTQFRLSANSLLRQELAGGNGALVAQVGRLHKQKGLHTFLEAAVLVLHRRPNTTFLLVGEGPLAGELYALVQRLGVSERVRFMGWREDVREILSVLDVAVLSSLWEGLPYGLLEPMAAGKPTVCTDADGNRDVALDGETGFVVPRSDPAALAQAILRLLEQPELARRMGEQGRQRVEEHFSLAAMIEKTEAVYDVLRKPAA